jgi:hypothetical protein|tara:strand:+ start:1863 stop:2099 length:237 start_codon:yes stop_codon:yes gene_type:complete
MIEYYQVRESEDPDQYGGVVRLNNGVLSSVTTGSAGEVAMVMNNGNLRARPGHNSTRITRSRAMELRDESRLWEAQDF